MRLQRKYNQDITYWAPAGKNDYGVDSYENPVLMIGRWENRQEEVRLPNGQESVSEAIVFVPSEVEVDGYLVLGDHTSAGNDPTLVGAKQIRAKVEIPSMRTNEVEKRAIL